MPSQLKKIQPNSQLFKLIYDLAEKQNEVELCKLQADIDYINKYFPGLGSVVNVLAKDGKSNAVQFLVRKFKASVNLATLGFSEGGYKKEISELFGTDDDHSFSKLHGCVLNGEISKAKDLLDKGLSTSIAAYFCAEKGLDQEVDYLRSLDMNIYYGALCGYASAGNKEKVNEIFAEYDTFLNKRAACYDITPYKDLCINAALERYLKGGYISEIENLIGRGVNLSRVILLLESEGYFKDENAVIEILATINDKELRETLAKAALASNPVLDSNILKKAFTLNGVMKMFDFSFEQAKLEIQKVSANGIFSNSAVVNEEIAANLDRFLSYVANR